MALPFILIPECRGRHAGLISLHVLLLHPVYSSNLTPLFYHRTVRVLNMPGGPCWSALHAGRPCLLRGLLSRRRPRSLTDSPPPPHRRRPRPEYFPSRPSSTRSWRVRFRGCGFFVRPSETPLSLAHFCHEGGKPPRGKERERKRRRESERDRKATAAAAATSPPLPPRRPQQRRRVLG